MQIEVVKSKIHRVKITQADLNYIGSITIDEKLMEASNIIEGEKVQVVNINNGERLETYAIKGTPGSGNGGVGYGLNGRGTPNYTLYDGCENEYGLIVVDIVVNRNGQVIEATPGVKGSNNATSCLNAQAKKIAMSYKWPADSKAPARQYGKVSVNFTPTN